MMVDGVNVTVMFMLPNASGGYSARKMGQVMINSQVSIKRLLPELVKKFPELKLESSEAKLLVQVQDEFNLSHIAVQNDGLLVIMPKNSEFLPPVPSFE